MGRQNTIGFSIFTVNGIFNCPAGDDLPALLKLIVTQSELLDCAVEKGFLIVKNELFTVRRFQRN